MKRKQIIILGIVAALSMNVSMPVLAVDSRQNDLQFSEQEEFERIVVEIENIKIANPEFTEIEILNIMSEIHSIENKGIMDIWNSLTDSEKKLCIRYPFDALKVNKAKNVAADKTVEKFGENGLGNRSDAFRHGVWNAEMSILIGSEKAELFATAHEDKDVSGDESDGFPKTDHKEMDLHNNEVGRHIGEENRNVSEDELADIIYSNIYSESTQFVWLHD